MYFNLIKELDEDVNETKNKAKIRKTKKFFKRASKEQLANVNLN